MYKMYYLYPPDLTQKHPSSGILNRAEFCVTTNPNAILIYNHFGKLIHHWINPLISRIIWPKAPSLKLAFILTKKIWGVIKLLNALT